MIPNWQDILMMDAISYKSVGGSQLVGFLKNEVRSSTPLYLFDGSKEVTVKNGVPVSNEFESLGLLVYAGLNPNYIFLGSRFESVLGASTHAENLLAIIETFFQGNIVELPRNFSMEQSPRSFDSWNTRSETMRISPWLLAALRSFYGNDLRSACEVAVPLSGEKRPGRLDVVALQNRQIICFEAKTSIEAALKDSRFTEQIPKYKREIYLTNDRSDATDQMPLVFIVTGGSELDIKTTDFQMVPTALGQQFLKMCSQHRIKFVTANAIWQLLAMSLVSPTRKLDLVEVLETLSKEPGLSGLCSAGFVTAQMEIVGLAG